MWSSLVLCNAAHVSAKQYCVTVSALYLCQRSVCCSHFWTTSCSTMWTLPALCWKVQDASCTVYQRRTLAWLTWLRSSSAPVHLAAKGVITECDSIPLTAAHLSQALATFEHACKQQQAYCNKGSVMITCSIGCNFTGTHAHCS